jgi:hypothetical protein
VLAFIYLLPSLFMALFARAYLHRRVIQIWKEAGLPSSKAKWMMDVVEGMAPSVVVGGFGFIVLRSERARCFGCGKTLCNLP